MKRAPDNVRYLGQFREHILTRSFTAVDPDCVETRKLSEDGASGTNFYAPPSRTDRKWPENQLKFINRGPAVRVFTRAGPKADVPARRDCVRGIGLGPFGGGAETWLRPTIWRRPASTKPRLRSNGSGPKVEASRRLK